MRKVNDVECGVIKGVQHNILGCFGQVERIPDGGFIRIVYGS